MRSNGAILDVNGEIVASPEESDVSAAVDRAAQQAGGHVTVTRSGGFFLEAAPSGGGSGDLFSLACGDEQKGQRQFATAPVTRTQAKTLFSDFLDGGDAWRRQCRWRSRNTPAAASTAMPLIGSWRSSADCLAGVGAVAFMLVVVVVPMLFPAAVALALCIFVVGKARREVRVRRWPQANGRITASGLQPRRRRFRREATRLDNIPSLGYEFSVAGRPYVGSRLGLNTEYGGVDIGALVARYPVGAIVPVYYNPADPNDCLLDPFANRGLSGDVLKLFAILGAFFAALYYGASAATHAVAAHFYNANAPHVVFASSFRLLSLLLFVRSFRPQPRTAAMLRASGAIVKSEVEQVTLNSALGMYGGNTNFQPTIEVAYSVGGQNYILRTSVGGVAIAIRTLGWAKKLGLERRFGTRPIDAQARLAPYPVGKAVNVLYNPNDPGAASLAVEGIIADGRAQTYYYRVIALTCAFAGFVIATIALGVL
jgi:Protein of unknown function (DUF3592)